MRRASVAPPPPPPGSRKPSAQASPAYESYPNRTRETHKRAATRPTQGGTLPHKWSQTPTASGTHANVAGE